MSKKRICSQCGAEIPQFGKGYCEYCLALPMDVSYEEGEMNDFFLYLEENCLALLEDKFATRAVLTKYLKPIKLATVAAVLIDSHALEWLHEHEKDKDNFEIHGDSYLSRIVQQSGLEPTLLEYLFYSFAYLKNISKHVMQTEYYLRQKAEKGNASAWYRLAHLYRDSVENYDSEGYIENLIRAMELGNSEALYEYGCLYWDTQHKLPELLTEKELYEQIYHLAFQDHIGAICLCMKLMDENELAPNKFSKIVMENFDQLKPIQYLHLCSYYKTRGKKIYERCVIKGMQKDSRMFADEYCSYLLTDKESGVENLALYLKKESDSGYEEIAEKWILRLLREANGTSNMGAALACLDSISLNDIVVLQSLGNFFQYETNLNNHLRRATAYFYRAAKLGSKEATERLRFDNPKTPCKWLELELEDGDTFHANILKVIRFNGKKFMVLDISGEQAVIEYWELKDPLDLNIEFIEDEDLIEILINAYEKGVDPDSD